MQILRKMNFNRAEKRPSSVNQPASQSVTYGTVDGLMLTTTHIKLNI